MLRGARGAEHHGVRIIHCDDSEAYRALLRVLLERHPGLEVAAEAAGGEEAIVKALATEPDAVILDLDMPHGHGLDALPSLSLIAPVYVLSGSGDPSARASAEAAGAAGWFRKGHDEQRLVERLLTNA